VVETCIWNYLQASVKPLKTCGYVSYLSIFFKEQEVTSVVAQEIPPFETKPIMKANFVGRTERNHTAFIRIRTGTDDLLVLPVEVEVSPHPGIYSPLEMLDFGLLRSHDVSRVLNLNLLNSGAHSIHIVVGVLLVFIPSHSFTLFDAEYFCCSVKSRFEH
jgi:hypothetical protein